MFRILALADCCCVVVLLECVRCLVVRGQWWLRLWPGCWEMAWWSESKLPQSCCATHCKPERLLRFLPTSLPLSLPTSQQGVHRPSPLLSSLSPFVSLSSLCCFESFSRWSEKEGLADVFNSLQHYKQCSELLFQEVQFSVKSSRQSKKIEKKTDVQGGTKVFATNLVAASSCSSCNCGGGLCLQGRGGSSFKEHTWKLCVIFGYREKEQVQSWSLVTATKPASWTSLSFCKRFWERQRKQIERWSDDSSFCKGGSS